MRVDDILKGHGVGGIKLGIPYLRPIQVVNTSYSPNDITLSDHYIFSVNRGATSYIIRHYKNTMAQHGRYTLLGDYYNNPLFIKDEYLYIDSGRHNQIRKVDVESFTDVAVLNVNANVLGVISVGDYLFVREGTYNSLLRVDITTMSLDGSTSLKNLGLGSGISTDGEYIYVSVEQGRRILKYNTSLELIADSGELQSFGSTLTEIMCYGDSIYQVFNNTSFGGITKYNKNTFQQEAVNNTIKSGLKRPAVMNKILYISLGRTINAYDLKTLERLEMGYVSAHSSIDNVSVDGDYIYASTAINNYIKKITNLYEKKR